MSFRKDEFEVWAKEIAQQVAQEVAQQQVKQIAQAVEQEVQALKQAVQGSQQEKVSFAENKAEEILGGEGIRAGIVSGVRMWNHNDKDIVARERDYDLALKSLELKNKALEIAEREAKLRKQADLDAISISERENAALFKHAVNMDYAKFNNAVSEPIAPNTQDSGAQE